MIKKLDWDSVFFEIEVGELIYENQIKLENANDYNLIYVKSKSAFKLGLENFTENFSEVKVVFSKTLKDNNSDEKNIISIEKTNFKIVEIYELAYESGKYSRFFLDKNFKTNKFQDLYQKWVDNSINKQFANDLLVYIENEIIQGFVTYKIHDKIATIGLIAVSPNYQGKGIGGKLINYLENILFKNNIKTLAIPTQESNVGAVGFYKKHGYRITETTIIKHYWKN